MANPEHVEIVRAGKDAIDEWRHDNPEVSLDLEGASLAGTNLAGADLVFANLANADFSGANLVLADLTRAYLRCAIFSGANLRGTNLSLADLVLSEFDNADLCEATLALTNCASVNFESANLRESTLEVTNCTNASFERANLSKAWLVGTVFKSTNLRYTDFKRAQLRNVSFDGVDLSQTQFLETAVCQTPSSIGIDTIYLSGGKIPESFLRGCGVPDEMIRYIPSLTNDPIQFYSVFISYSHKDQAFAQRLYDTLQGRGIRCWKDDHQLLPGDDIRTGIDQGVRIYDKVLLCASKNSLSSNWCDKEIRKAFAKEEQLNTKPSDNIRSLIPLNIDGYMFSDNWRSPYAIDIRERVAPDFTNWKKNHDKFEREVEKVIKALALHDRMREPHPKPMLGNE